MTDFKTLFQPGNIGKLSLKNRLIMPAMGTQLPDAQGKVTQRFLDYYRARAAGGVGLIIPQFAAVSSDATMPFNVPIYDDSWVSEWKKVVDAVHAFDARIGIQLMHIGMIYLYAGFVPEGLTVKVPSMMPWLRDDMPYHEVTEEDIERYIQDFGEAARRAKEAGADLVELHACHGCLVSTFMSPITNRRTDQYGGSIENRARFARRVVERMRQEVGPEFPISVRINADDDIEGGVSLDEVIQQAVILEDAGADAISVSGGLEYWSTLSIPCYPYPEGPMVPLAEKVKKAVKVPVIVAGKINAELAVRVLEEGKADFIAMGRPLLADPDLPNKVRQGRPDQVRRCIYCNNCLKDDPQAGPGACSVNPFLNREARYPLPAAERPKRVMVVGGGLAGMQTAMFLAERGHQVSLYERSERLGGQWNVASATPGKERYATFVDYLKGRLDERGVTVTLGTEVNREKVLEVKPDVVVVATGASPVVLNVPGATGKNVVQGHDVLEGKVPVKGRAVVVGGRFIGMEVAIWLAEQGKEVSLVTRAGLGEDGIRLEKLTFKTLAGKLVDLRVPLYLHSKVLEITDNAVVVSLGDGVFSIPADTVILAVGMRPENRLAQELEGAAPEVYTVGDCVRPRDAAEVAYQASSLAAKI